MPKHIRDPANLCLLRGHCAIWLLCRGSNTFSEFLQLAHFEEETGSMYLLTTTASISPALKGCMAECEIQYHVIQIENPVSLSVSVD